MAIPAQGCVITWSQWQLESHVALQEVRDLDIRPAIERIEFRGRTFFWRGGELTITGFSNAALPASKILAWGTLKITVPVQGGNLVLHESYAQYLSSSIRGTVNEAVLFAFQFRLWGAFSSIGTTE